MRRSVRVALGLAVGGAALAAYLAVVGVEDVGSRLRTVAPWAVALVVGLVVAEAVTDTLGVWASVAPLGDGLTARQSVTFALAGDFFDTVSPAGPASSEPILARFVGVETGTTYGEALAVRSVAKYVKGVTQLAAAIVAGGVVLLAGAGSGPGSDGAATVPTGVLAATGVAVVAVVVAGAVLVYARASASRAAVGLLAPVVRRASGWLRGEPIGRADVADAVGRFRARVGAFRGRPGLLVLIAVGGVAEQVLQALAIRVALTGVGTDPGTATATAASVVLLVAVVPLPQVASVVPVPGSVGTYDVLLGGAVALATGVPAAVAAAAVLLVRTISLVVWLVAGGVAAALLRGWRPRGTPDGDDGDGRREDAGSGSTPASAPAPGPVTAPDGAPAEEGRGRAADGAARRDDRGQP